jgi:hypothetical protein
VDVPAKITHQLNRQAVSALLTSPSGPVAKDLYRRGLRVQAKAKQELEEWPRRVDTGRLRSSVEVQLITVGGVLAVRIGSNVFYALYVHDGTGIYGPKGAPIKPKRAKVLKFQPKGAHGFVYARSVKGMIPNPFLKKALKAAKTP